jgi:choice-of-anchor B domain-containing protein
MALSPMVRLFAAALLCTTTAATQTPPTNARLLASVNRFPGAVTPNNNYAGIWGMVVNGREYAIVPTRTGTLFYDCHDPRNPVEVGFISGPTTSGQYFWREAQSYGTWVYVSSEHGATQVIDMSTPTAPRLAGSFGGNAHTVTIDQARGHLWANGGAGNGCRIYNLNVNPASPTLLRTYNPAYVHDSYVVRNHAYLGHIFGGTMRIVNATNISSITTLSNTPTPGAFTHNVWTNDFDTVAITADENNGGCMTVYDITNKSAPAQRAVWCSPNGATVHNVFMKGEVAHFSAYSDGYWAIDLSVPTQPRVVAHFDTTSLTGNDYHGCWGCYPFQPSGVVYLTDMQNGFFIVEPTAGVPLDYGDATNGQGGRAPRLGHDGGPLKVGNATHVVTADYLPASSGAALIVGAARAQIPFLGMQVLVDPANALFLSSTADANGRATVSLPVPNNPVLALGALQLQLVALDAAAPQGLRASRGRTVVVVP